MPLSSPRWRWGQINMLDKTIKPVHNCQAEHVEDGVTIMRSVWKNMKRMQIFRKKRRKTACLLCPCWDLSVSLYSVSYACFCLSPSPSLSSWCRPSLCTFVLTFSPRLSWQESHLFPVMISMRYYAAAWRRSGGGGPPCQSSWTFTEISFSDLNFHLLSGTHVKLLFLGRSTMDAQWSPATSYLMSVFSVLIPQISFCADVPIPCTLRIYIIGGGVASFDARVNEGWCWSVCEQYAKFLRIHWFVSGHHLMSRFALWMCWWILCCSVQHLKWSVLVTDAFVAHF